MRPQAKAERNLDFCRQEKGENEASNRVVRGSKQVPMYEMRERSKYMKMSGRCDGPKFLSKRLDKWGRRHLGGHDLVRRMDRQGEVLIRCRKCSGYARQRMRPKRTNCCRPEQMDTKEFGKMMKRIQILEEGTVPAREAKNQLENRGRKEKNNEKGV